MLAKMPSALVLSLEGNLGSGKTTFAQAFARALGIRAAVLSPTFVLVKKYSLPGRGRGKKPAGELYHIDCYRLRRPRELTEIGWREIISQTGRIVLVEWGDKIRRLLPPQHLRVTFRVTGKTGRRIALYAT